MNVTTLGPESLSSHNHPSLKDGLIKDGKIFLPSLTRKQEIARQLFYLFAEVDELIGNLNLILTDLDQLCEHPRLFAQFGSLLRRSKLLLRSFFCEFSRFEDLYGYFLVWFERLGGISKQERNTLRDQFHELVKPMVNVRNIMLHDAINWALWAKPWSILDPMLTLKRGVEDRNVPGLCCHLQQGKSYVEDFSLRVELHTPEETVQQALERWLPIIRDVCEEVDALLTVSVRKGSLVYLFSFAPEVKMACEQYLLYFVQFLEDLGIRATADLQEQARGVLFTVTPESGLDALGRIREALDLYLVQTSTQRSPATATLLSSSTPRMSITCGHNWPWPRQSLKVRTPLSKIRTRPSRHCRPRISSTSNFSVRILRDS